MNTKIRTFCMIAAALLLQACAGPVQRLEEPDAEGSLGSKTTLLIEDKRPADDKDFSAGSIIVMSSNYGIVTIGDNQFEPSVVDTLKIRLQRAFSRMKNPPQKVKITLERLITQRNMQAYLRRTSSAELGPLGIWIVESMAGHKFDMTVDQTKPFFISVLKGRAEITWPNQTVTTVPLDVVHARNFQNIYENGEPYKTMVATINAVLDATVDSVAQSSASVAKAKP
jgi:hypothetical protein